MINNKFRETIFYKHFMILSLEKMNRQVLQYVTLSVIHCAFLIYLTPSFNLFYNYTEPTTTDEITNIQRNEIGKI